MISSAALFTSDATFSVAAAPLFFCHQQKAAESAAFLFAEKAAAPYFKQIFCRFCLQIPSQTFSIHIFTG